MKKKQKILFILSFVIFLIFLLLFEKKIFASSKSKQEIQIEENREVIDIEKVIQQNTQMTKRKELVTENRKIEYEIKYQENDDLPKDEQVVVQKGILGEKLVTVVKSYQEERGIEKFIDEKILNATVIKNPTEQIVEVGTSEILGQFQVHIGDKLYVIEDTELRENADSNSRVYTTVAQYLDVKILGVKDEFIKVKYDNYEGYIDSNYVVSEVTNPEYVQKCKIKRMITSVYPEMDVGMPSGLSLEEFKKALSDNPRDVNKIFENNAETFYFMELKYNVNGLLLAAIGIHESAWGTSAIAKDKKNLFGYGAYDASPYKSAFTFDEYSQGIETLARALAKNYLNPAGTILSTGETATGAYFNGRTIASINIRYATDPNWGNAVYNIMEGLYEKLR